MKIFCLLGLAITYANSFLLNVPITSYKRNYDNNIIKVYEPKNIPLNELRCLVFYTGANSIIPADIYSNFIRTLNNYNFSVNVVNNRNEITTELLYDIRDIYKEIIPVSHSSGYVNIIKTINKQKNIKKAVFLDPVDNSKLINNNILDFLTDSQLEIKNLENVLILNAEKSYKGSIFPKIEIPFIPVFGLNLKKFEKDNPNIAVSKIVANDYGHSDVLDILWSDLMHVTLSKGNPNREQSQMDEYHNWLAQEIYKFTVNNGENDSQSDYQSDSPSDSCVKIIENGRPVESDVDCESDSIIITETPDIIGI